MRKWECADPVAYYVHIVVKIGVGGIEVQYILVAGWVVQHGDDIRERIVLHAAECVSGKHLLILFNRRAFNI
jgi:hypothetical protein